MRALPIVLAGVAALAVVEVAVNVGVRPQTGPLALAAVLEPYLLAIGVVAGVLAVLLTLADRSPAGSRIRLLAVVVVVVGVVRLGGEWWSPGPPDTAGAVGEVVSGQPGAGPPASGPSASESAFPASPATRLTVLSWNLETGSKSAATSLSGILEAAPKPDLVALQELTTDVAAALDGDPTIRSRYPYRILEPRDGVGGMGLLSRHPLFVGTYSTQPVVLRAELLLPDGSRVEVLNAHPYPPDVTRAFDVVPVGLDTRGRDEDLAAIAATVGKADDPARVLVVGDLNTTPFEPGFGTISAGLTDAHAAVGTGTGFTWRPAPLELLNVGMLRIDHVLTGDAWQPMAVSEDCSLPGDHCRLSVTLEISAT